MKALENALYVTGTPIGNLEDITQRQIEVLEQVDFIVAEDTRVTRKLLSAFEIHKPLISYYEHKLEDTEIINRLEAGESCAIVTDAGMPCISDPGELLVKHCVERSIPVYVVPGPSAVISALAVSGLSTSRFAFEGFLSRDKKERQKQLSQVETDTHTLIFYEAPHRLKESLRELYQSLGDRKIALCRELTKLHEEVLRMHLSEAIAYYQENEPKGEFVLVIEGAQEQIAECYTIEMAIKMVEREMEKGAKLTEACKAVAKETGLRKNEIYQRMTQNE